MHKKIACYLQPLSLILSITISITLDNPPDNYSSSRVHAAIRPNAYSHRTYHFKFSILDLFCSLLLSIPPIVTLNNARRVLDLPQSYYSM